MDAQLILTPVPLTDLLGQFRQIVKDVLNEKQTADLQEKLLSPKQTADLLGVSLVTIWSWERAGKITKHSMAGRNYYKYSELMAGLDTLQRYRKTGTRGAAAAS